MAVFPTSTGNFIIRKDTHGSFDFALNSSASAINLSSVALSMNFQHTIINTDVCSFHTSATSPRLSVQSATNGFVRFSPMSGDFINTGVYNYYFTIWDVNSVMSYIPEHRHYNLNVQTKY